MEDNELSPGQEGERSRAARQRAAALLALVVASILVVETGRVRGYAIPVPYMLILGSGALAAALAGFRTALAAASLGVAYIWWGLFQGFGPDTLTGSAVNAVLSTILAYSILGALGYEHDVRKRLLRLLRERERELVVARDRLSGSVARKTEDLQRTRSELSDVRYQMEQGMRSAPIGVMMIDADLHIRFFNDAALQQLGTSAMPPDITTWAQLAELVEIRRPDNKRVRAPHGPVSAVLRDGVSVSDYETRILGIDGETRWCSAYFEPLRSTPGDVIGVLVMTVDTTVQKEAGRALQQLTRMLFRVQEDERSRLSRELHEHIGQSLSAIKFSLYSSTAGQPASAALEGGMAQLDRLTQSVRQLSLDLRPTALDDFGLQTAVNAYLDRERPASDAALRLSAPESLPGVDGELATIAYRVTQEAVRNAIGHAGATVIEVGLAADDDTLIIDVSDDGDGFDVDKTRLRAAAEGKMGLLFMRERIRQRGGELVIDSAAGKGTRVQARLPLVSGAMNAEDTPGPD